MKKIATFLLFASLGVALLAGPSAGSFMPTLCVIKEQTQTTMNLLAAAETHTAPGLMVAAERVAMSLSDKLARIYEVDTAAMTDAELAEYCVFLVGLRGDLASLRDQATAMGLTDLSASFEASLAFESAYIQKKSASDSRFGSTYQATPGGDQN